MSVSETSRTVPIGRKKSLEEGIGQQINDYLRTIDAKVDSYRFSIEKVPDGLTIDLAFKATIKRKTGLE